MTATPPPALYLPPDPRSPTWAMEIAAEAERLRATGMRPQRAWMTAAGVGPLPKARPGKRNDGYGTLTRTVVAWVLAQPAPVTAMDAAEALGESRQAVSDALRSARHRGDVAEAGRVVRYAGRRACIQWWKP